MELIIQEHMYNTLFEKKSVSCRRDLYLRFYPVLWPCEDAFRDFLKKPDTSLQLSATKTIYSCIGQEENVFLPQFTWKNLIQLQQKQLVDKPGGYIPQDHVIHSTNLYILGIYTFFNLPILQRKILRDHGDTCTETQRMLQFIKKWKLFSFYHDLGYVFESITGNDGEIGAPEIFSEYPRLRENILSECISRSVSRLIVATTLVQRCGANFHLDENVLTGVKWVDETGETWTPEALYGMLMNVQNYKLLEDVQSMEGFRQLFPFLQHVGYLAVVENPQNGLLAFFSHGIDESTQLVYNYNAGLAKDTLRAIRNSLPLHFEEMSIRYYLCVETFWNNLLGHDSTYQTFEREVPHFNKFLPERFRRQFSLICDDSTITQIFYDIGNWHRTNWFWKDKAERNSDGSLDYDRKAMGDCFTRALQESIRREIQSTLKDTKLTVENLQGAVESLGEKIKAIDIAEIQRIATQNYKKRGIPTEIFNYSNRCYDNMLRELGSQKTESYIQIKNKTITVLPFLFEDNNEFAKALYSRMEELASALGLELSVLESYRPDFSSCDHGVLSAAILFQALAVFRDIEKVAANHFPIRCAWDTPEGFQMMEPQSIQLYADVVFSILLHNVYTQNAKPEYGLHYQQDIDQNPFSYFCTLMDGLQKWSRPKQIDHSAIDLPEDHYLGNDVDINVSKGRLRIICHSSRAGVMRAQLELAEDYLPGILSLVCITEEET